VLDISDADEDIPFPPGLIATTGKFVPSVDIVPLCSGQ
jgi:hypothetical protein